MTDTNTKVRSLILTALMVVSVFGGSIAFAGAATAATGSSYTVANTAPGATTTVTAQIQSEADGKSVGGVELNFNGASDPDFDGSFEEGSSSAYTVTVYNADGTEKTTVDSVSLSSSNGGETVSLTFSSVTVNAGETLEVEGTGFTNPSADGDYEGTIQFNPSSSGEQGTDVLEIGSSTGDTPSGDNPTADTTTGPVDVTQGPVEFNYPSNSDSNHVEVVFDQAVDPSAYTFDVLDSDDNVAFEDVGVNDGLSQGTRVILNLPGDVSGEATLNVDNDDAADGATAFNEDFSLTTTSLTLEDGQDATKATFQGANVAILDADEFDSEYDVFRTSTGDGNPAEVQFGGSTGVNSVVTVENDGLEAGETYEVRFDGGSTETVNVRSLGLNVEADDLSVSFTEDESAELSATVTTNFGNRNVEARLIDSDDEEVASQQIEVDGDREAAVSFDRSTAGNYTIEVEDVATGITAETDEIEVSSVTGEVEFTENVFTEERGDVAEITVDLDNVDETTVLIGSNEVNYYGAVTVADAAEGDDNDGQVTLQLNTFLTTSSEPEAAFTAVGDDTIEDVQTPDEALSSIAESDVEADLQTSAPLADADYDLAAYVGGEEQTVGTLIINERSATGMNLWTAPAATFGDAEEPADVYSAIEDGAITQSEEIAAEDTLVHQIQIEGVYGALAAQGDVDPEVALENLLTNPVTEEVEGEDDPVPVDQGDAFDEDGESTPLSLSVVQAGSSPNQDPKRLVLSESTDALNVVVDDANNTVFVNVDTSEDSGAQFFRGEEGETYDPENDELVGAEPGETYDVTFTLEPESGLTADDQTEESLSATFDVTERAGMLNGGEDVTVEAASDQVISGTTDVAPGTEITMRARATGDNPFLQTANDVTVASDGTFSGTFDFSDVAENTTFTVTASATPQFVDNEALTADGTVGAAAAETPTATPTPTPEPATETPTPTPTPEPATETPTPTPEPATETPTDGGDGATETETSGSQPGFGGAVAIVALAGAALIALRRGN